MMMQKIHDKSKGWFATIIISMIIFTFIMWGVQGFVSYRSMMNDVAEVNSVPIKFDVFEKRFQNVMTQVVNQYGDKVLGDATMKQRIKENLLNDMIKHELLRQASEHLGLKVGDAQLQNVIERVPAFQENGDFSAEKFEAFLKSRGENPTRMLEDLEQNLILYQLRSVFALGAFSLDEEVDRALELFGEKRDVRFMSIKRVGQPLGDMPSEEAIKSYYDKHHERFAIPEEVKLDYIELDAKSLHKKIDITESMLKQHYDENINNYKTPKQWHLSQIVITKDAPHARERLKEVQEKLKQGEQFESLAKTYSEDVITNKQGGDLGWVTEAMLTKEMKSTLAFLKTKGDTSEPFVDEHGYTILKINGIKPEVLPSYKELKAKVQEEILAQKTQKLYSEYADQLANLTFSNPDTLEVASEELGLAIKHTGFFNKDQGVDPLTELKQIRHIAFTPDVLEARNNSDVIQVESDRVVVVRVNEHKPKQYKSLESLRAVIRGELIKEAQRKNVRNLAKVLSENINEKKPIDKTMRFYNLTWNEIKNLKRDDKKQPDAVITAAFENNQGQAVPVYLPDGDAYVVEIQSIMPGQPKKVGREERDSFVKNIAESRGQLAYQLYEDYLHDKAKIKIHQEILDRIH